MIRINEVKLSLNCDESSLAEKAASVLKCKKENVKSIRILKKSIDSRKKEDICFVYNLAVETDINDSLLLKNARNSKISQYFEEPYLIPENKRTSTIRPIIVGFGPAGFMAALTLAKSGLNPIVIERGADVETRHKQVLDFWNYRKLNADSNVQFGEGGAGTFSDGKLTTGIKSPFISEVIRELINHGAPEEIAYSATPHIGTDRLGDVVKSIREEIISLGGEIHFNTKLTDLILANNSIQGITVTDKNGSRDIEADTLILCIGHSARDTVEMLYRKGINIIQKPFSMGARIEHPRELIDKSQYGKFAGHPKLGAAVYKLACHPDHGRGAYTFCMCPGGTVVCASSEENKVVVNGMSEYARNGENSNSAILVGIEPEQFDSDHPLAGIEIQRKIEERAFEAGERSYAAPCQTVRDFLSNQKSKKLSSVKPTCPTGTVPGDMREILPKRITDTISSALIKMDKMLQGFAMPDAVLTFPETRSSSPVRILRNDILQSNIRGIYPCGEGAGYAGGIVSAAVDGIKCAHAVLLDETDDM